MKKRTFLFGLVVLLLNLAAIEGEGLLPAVTFSATELLGRPTDTSITVNIVPSANGQIYFEYGTSPGSYTAGQTTTATLTSGTPTELVMQGLSPNTRYYYRRVSSDNGVSWVNGPERTFHTQRYPNSTFAFTITSDSHVNIMLGNASTWTATMNNVADDYPDFEIDCGDTFAMDSVSTVSGANQAYLYQRQFFDLVGHSSPVFLALGNHEEEEAWHLDDTGNPATSQPVMGANARKKFYPNPIPDAFYSGNTDPYSYLDGDHLREDYYAWTWGDALFIVLDPYWYTTTKPFVGNTGGGEGSDTGSGDRWDWTLGSAQFNWLKQTLENSAAKYKFMFAHHMTGGSDDYVRGGAGPAHICEWGGYNENGTTWGWNTRRPVAQWGSDPVHQIMVANHVSAFFHGHDHQYGYEKRDGIVYQALPSGGFSGGGFGLYSTGVNYCIQALNSPGHLRVTVTPAEATVDYIATSGGGVNYSYAIAPTSVSTKVDFNKDGQEDILWRYYGAGGANAVWFMGDQGGAAPGLSMPGSPRPVNPALRDGTEESGRPGVFSDPRDAGIVGRGSDTTSMKDPRDFGASPSRNRLPALALYDPRMVPAKSSGPALALSPQRFVDPRLARPLSGTAAASETGISSSQQKTIIGSVGLGSISDLSWQIAGTGDFNGDGSVDILWRYNGTGGYICVWFMNGTTLTGSIGLGSVSDLSWQIGGTGDFNGDLRADILWRNYGGGGENCVWYMEGTTLTGSVGLGSVSDVNWQIARTGDFDGNGTSDILWRFNGSGGSNCIWYMDGVALQGSVGLPPVADLGWKIVNR